MKAEEITWQDPPNSKSGPTSGREVDEFVIALKTRPGQWALYPRRMSVAWPTGLKRRHPNLQVKRRMKGDDADGKHRADIYLRWLPEASNGEATQ